MRHIATDLQHGVYATIRLSMMESTPMRRIPPLRLSTRPLRAIALLLTIAVIAVACGGSTDTASIEGIDSNDGGVTVKPPDVLDGETEVIDGQDTAPQAGEVETADTTVEAPETQLSGLMPAPDIAFTWFDGIEDSVAGLQGKPTVLNFWASTCAACIAEMPDFEEVNQDFGDSVQFIGLNVDETSIEDARQLVENTGVTYPIAIGASRDSVEGIIAMPTTIVYTPDGVRCELHSGTLNAEALTSLIQECSNV